MRNLRSMREHSVCNRTVPKADFQALKRQYGWAAVLRLRASVFLKRGQESSVLSVGLKVWQVDLCEFKAILVYRASSRIARAT